MSFNRASGGRTNYVGLNVSIACQTRFVRNLEGITTDITISNSNGTEVGASERFIITDTTSGDDFERTLTFTPISEGDAGVYLCTGTAQSAILNPLVTAGTGGENLTISTVHGKEYNKARDSWERDGEARHPLKASPQGIPQGIPSRHPLKAYPHLLYVTLREIPYYLSRTCSHIHVSTLRELPGETLLI